MGIMDDLFAELKGLKTQLKRLEDQKAIQQRDLEYRMDTGESRDAWQVAEEDNVDAANGLLVDIYIPPNGVTRAIQQVLLRVKLKAFRSYSAVTASGGSSNPSTSTQAQTIPSTTSVVVSTASVGGGGDTSGASSNETTTNNSTSFSYNSLSFLQSFGTVTNSTHDHALPAGAEVATGISDPHTTFVWSADGAHSHAIGDHYHPHYHTLAHFHSTPNHSHTITNITHGHSVTIDAHAHTVSIDPHTHPITGAITTGTTASLCTILVNGTDRTVALTGAATFNVDKDELDVTEYMTATGYNTIEITSATLGRVRATAFVNLYLNNR